MCPAVFRPSAPFKLTGPVNSAIRAFAGGSGGGGGCYDGGGGGDGGSGGAADGGFGGDGSDGVSYDGNGAYKCVFIEKYKCN